LPNAFTILWAGQLVSNFGTQTSLYALGLWLFQRDGQLSSFATVAIVILMAKLLALPLLGRRLAGWPRRRVMLIANGLGGTVTLLLAVALMRQAVPLAFILALLSLAAVAEATLVLCFASLIPQMVPMQHLGRANGLFANGEGLVMATAPIFGATLAGIGGLPGALVLDGATCLVALACVALVRWPRVALAPLRPRQVWVPGLRAGVAELWASSSTRPLLLLGTTVAFALAACDLLFPAWVVTAMGASRLSVALAVGAGGYGLGMIAWQAVQHRRWALLLLSALAVQSVILIGAGLVVFEELPMIWFAGLALFSAGVPIVGAALQCLWQAAITLDQQPRLFAARFALEWGARLSAFFSSAIVVDRLVQPAMSWTLWPIWIKETMGFSAGRAMAIGIFVVGWLLLVVLVWQSEKIKRQGTLPATLV
jgi:MFS family permease